MADTKHTETNSEAEGLSRRQVLAGLPIAGAAVAIPTAAQADTPILRLFREHQELVDAANSHALASAPGAAVDALLDRLYYGRIGEICDEIMPLPCEGVGDFAAKVIIETARGEMFSDWKTAPIWQEARVLTGGAA